MKNKKFDHRQLIESLSNIDINNHHSITIILNDLNKGEDLILNRNMFVEDVLPSAIIRKLTDEEMKNYRTPFSKNQDRQPTLNWPRQIPISGEPKHMVELVKEYSQWIM